MVVTLLNAGQKEASKDTDTRGVSWCERYV
jgi:hypothetical protein